MVPALACKDYVHYLKKRIVRKNENDQKNLKTELQRCLGIPQLTFIGIGNTIGVGIYVLLGVLAKEYAGPSSILCFLIAISVTLMNALVYAEFSSSVTQTGASYTFFYKVGGEFLAFLCGWMMLMSMLASGCVGARAWSNMLDSWFNHSIQIQSKEVFGEIQLGLPFSQSLDLVAFLFQIVLTFVVSCNVRCSSILNTVLSLVTVSVLVFVAVAGMLVGDVDNFLNQDHGGFFPFGISGVIKGASLAVYACSGFDSVSMAAEEAKDPQKSVPRAIVLELLVVAIVYIAAAIGVLFLIPYWLLDTTAPLPSAFAYKGYAWGKLFVTLGPLVSFTNLQMLNLFSTSRLMYRMASDGLFFRFFLAVNKKTGVPVNSTILIGTLSSIFALMLDLSFLIDVTILLMLLTFIFLGSLLIKLKVKENSSRSEFKRSPLSSSSRDNKPTAFENESTSDLKIEDENDHSGSNLIEMSNGQGMAALVETTDAVGDQSNPETNSDSECDTLFTQGHGQNSSSHSKVVNKRPSDDSYSLKRIISRKCSLFVPGVLPMNLVIFMHWLCCIVIALQIRYGWDDLVNGSVVALSAISLLLFLLLLLTFLLWTQKSEEESSSFQTPLMPLIPTLSILFSSMLFFSSGKAAGFMELVVLVAIGSFLYCLLVYIDMRSIKAVSSTSGVSEDTVHLINDGESSEEDEL